MINVDLDHQVLVEQFKSVYRATLPNLLANITVGSELVYGLWKVGDQQLLSGWLLSLFALVVARLIFFLRYRHELSPEKMWIHRLFNTLNAIFFGVVWGLGAALIAQKTTGYYSHVTFFVVAGMASGALSSLSYYLPAILYFLPLAILPASVSFFEAGDSAHLILSFFPLMYLAGLCIYSIEMNRTFITSLRLRFQNIQLAEALREQKEIAEQANVAKSKFLAEASHDLRQPLYALTLLTSSLTGHVQNAKGRELVEKISRSVTSMQSLFNNLLDLSRYEVGAIPVEKSDFSLGLLFEQLALEFNPQALAKGLHIVWPQSQYRIYSDPVLFSQIMRNLIGNAVRYTQQGRVCIECCEDGDSLVVSVVDTGVGIAEENQRKIFEEFTQVTSPSKQENKGVGLGLAIVKRIATLLDYRVDLISHEGCGSTFSVAVPLSEHASGNEEASLDAERKSELSETALIVIVDDDPAVRDATEKLLSDWGCQLVVGESSAAVLATLRAMGRAPDGIISDYQLNAMETGLDVIQRIRAFSYQSISHQLISSQSIPALLVTGDINYKQLVIHEDSSVQVLQKPVAPLKLRTFVRRCAHQNHQVAVAEC